MLKFFEDYIEVLNLPSEEEPVKETEKKEAAKPATFAQSLVAGIESGKQKK